MAAEDDEEDGCPPGCGCYGCHYDGQDDDD
jgi:hypothetical protein